MTRHFEYSEGASDKFWEVTLEAATLSTRYGKIGTSGQSTLKSFADATLAQAALEKLVKEKVKKGYVEISSTQVLNEPELRYLEHPAGQAFFEIAEDHNHLQIRRGSIGKPCLVYRVSYVTPNAGRLQFERLVKAWQDKGFVQTQARHEIIEGCVAGQLSAKDIEDHPVLSKFLDLGYAEKLRGTRKRIIHFANGLQVDDNFDLEEVADMGLEAGLIIEGDVRVSGVFSQLSYTYPTSTLITGSVYAQSLGHKDSYMRINGDLRVENIVYGEYNDGVLEIGGDVYGTAWISADHDMFAGGTYYLPQFNSHEDDWEGLSSKVFDLDNSLDWDTLREFIWAGKSPLRKGFVFTPPNKSQPDEPESLSRVSTLEFENHLGETHPNIQTLIEEMSKGVDATLAALEHPLPTEILVANSWVLLDRARFEFENHDERFSEVFERLLQLGCDPSLVQGDRSIVDVLKESDNEIAQEMLELIHFLYPHLSPDEESQSQFYGIEILEQLIRLEDSNADFDTPEIKATWLTPVQNIFVARGQLPRIPESIGRFKNLNVLVLSLIEPYGLRLPASLNQLSKLKRLELTASLFTELPEITNLKKLTHLSLNTNKFTHLPQLPENLQELIIDDNPLLEPPDFSNLGQLKQLSLNQIKVIPKGLEKLLELERVFWSDAKLEVFPETLASLPKLEYLVLSNNRISSVPNLGGLKSLKLLDLRNCDLEKLPEGLLELPKLEKLFLADNPKPEKLVDQIRDPTQTSILEKLRAKRVKFTEYETDEFEPETKPKTKNTKTRRALIDIKKLNKQANDLQTTKPNEAFLQYQKVLDAAKEFLDDFPQDFKYEYLFALQGKLWCQNALVERDPKLIPQAIVLAEEILEYTQNQFDFYYSEEGELSRSAQTLAHNALAWYFLQSGQKLEEALKHIEEAVSELDYTSQAETYAVVLENKVKILMALEHYDQAYGIVFRMHKNFPELGFFVQITQTSQYKQWDEEN